MAKKIDKAIIVGIDAPIVPRMYRFAQEGHLPTIKKLFLDGGVWAKNCLVPLPTVTPPNWAAIITGAWPATTGISEFNVHVPGTELDESHMALHSEDMRCETIYEALAKVGKKSIICNYPTTWPPKVQDSILIGGGSLHLNQWANRGVPFGAARGRYEFRGIGQARITNETFSNFMVFSCPAIPMAVPVEFHEASDWKNLPSGPVVAAELTLAFPTAPYKMESVKWYVLIHGSKATVCESKDTKTAIADLGKGQWSPVIRKMFQTEKGEKEGVFRIKLVDVSPDGKLFKLVTTGIAASEGYTHPASIANELKSIDGVPIGALPSWGMAKYGLIDLKTAGELDDIENSFMGDAVAYLMKTRPWNLYIMHCHPTDTFYHSCCNDLNDSDPKVRAPVEKAELELYQSIDRMCAKIFSAAGENTIMALVSDHGAKPRAGTVNKESELVTSVAGNYDQSAILEKAGLIVRDKDGAVDWSKTKAYGGGVHVYVNLKGRDPHGIVEPGEEYRKVQEEVIRTLYDYTDSETGKKPVVLALSKEDARILGMHGDWCGDVIVGISEYYGVEHGNIYPTASYGVGDLRGLFALSGPNIKKGVVIERTCWIQDLIPTICYLTGWPIPAQAEGAIVYQALENPNLRL